MSMIDLTTQRSEPILSAKVAARTLIPMGAAVSPAGLVIEADSVSLRRNGRPWMPVMGEFHFTRYPEAYWRDELLKMKAGGIDVVATYVFWIHHEQRQGEVDWAGRRDLRRFVETCQEAGLLVVLRIGPWCHGEVRHGGLPDWIVALGRRVRTNDAQYMAEAERWYGRIARQVTGLLWKDGGPIIGVQIENEYGGPAEHLLQLKRFAVRAGFDVPLYTRTGWPELSTPMPFGELLPLHGGYAEGFWDRSLEPMPGEYWKGFTFQPQRADANIATDHFGRREAKDAGHAYPFLTCELGGGMMSSYHRRVRIDPRDIHAMAIAKLGSGSNLLGYYMYHGGTNPSITCQSTKREQVSHAGHSLTLRALNESCSSLNESRRTSFTNYNDLPVMNYDFQAPLGAGGQVREHYHRLRLIHLFLCDFGEGLTSMSPVLPPDGPRSRDDTATLRWAVRMDGRSGCLFVNNCQRLRSMPAKPAVQFDLSTICDALPMPLTIPANPVAIPPDTGFFWMFHAEHGGAKLVYATAQPVCRLEEGEQMWLVFSEIEGVPAEFCFGHWEEVRAHVGRVWRHEQGQVVDGLTAGRQSAITIETANGRSVHVLLLSPSDALACWKGEVAGRPRLVLCSGGVVMDGDELRVTPADDGGQDLAIFPPPRSVRGEDGMEHHGQADGLWTRYAFPPAKKSMPVVMDPVQDAHANGVHSETQDGLPLAPTDSDFVHAAAWCIKLPAELKPDDNWLLRIHYAGDVARLYLDDELIADDFYNGEPLELAINHHLPRILRSQLILKVLPWRPDARVYLSDAVHAPDTAPPIGCRAEAVLRSRCVTRLILEDAPGSSR